MSKFSKLDGQDVVIESTLADMTPVNEGWKMAILKMLSSLGIMKGSYDEKVKLSYDKIKKVFETPAVIKWVADKNKKNIKDITDDINSKKDLKANKVTNFKSEDELNDWFDKYGCYGFRTDSNVRSLSFKERSDGGAVYCTVKCGNVLISVTGDTDNIHRISIPYKVEIKRENKYVDSGVVGYILGAPDNIELVELLGSIH